MAAQSRGVDFAGFHFSSLLNGRIDQVLKRRRVNDLSFLQAPGSLVHWYWVLDVVNFRHSNFINAKFYTITADPLARPGESFWQADFSGADLRGADFRDSYMRGAKFADARLDGADFRNANIYETDFSGSEGVYLSGMVEENTWRVAPSQQRRVRVASSAIPKSTPRV